MKLKLVSLSLCLLGLTGFSLQAQQSEIQYLSGTDKDHTITWDFFCTNGMNSGKWSTIQVPSHWEQQGFGSYLYGQVNLKSNEKGLYKYEFEVPETWERKKVNIVFEGSMTDTEVKINGKLAGPIHQGGFYQFSYDISTLLRFDGKNLLEVNVSKESTKDSINRAERIADYWVFGGIFRPVYLEASPEQCIDRVAIHAAADGTFYMDVFTEGASVGYTLEAQVQKADGNNYGKAITAVISGNTEKTILTGVFQNPELWNPEFPNLYRVTVRLKKGKKIIHEITQKFGFRTVEVRDADGIYVNGKKIMFRGVCRHTFWPSTGRTSSKQLAIDDVNLMKDMNMNAVRMSHYPPDQFFLDVCDSLGMFVLDELAGWQKFYDTPTAKRLVKELVIRDVNHPCIVLWDNGNEGGFNKEVRSDYDLYDPQHRTVIEPWAKLNSTDTKHYPKYDYVYHALNEGNLIYFPTEFLHGLFDGGHGAGLDDYWNLMLSKPLSAGGFLWVFADEGIERTDRKDSIDTQRDLAPDGILGPYHEKEGSFYTIKEIWAPVQFKKTSVTADFDGKFRIYNRFFYTSLQQCHYSYELVKFVMPFPDGASEKLSGTIVPPEIMPGDSGIISVDLPENLTNYDVLYITAVDPYGRHINTWSWNITGQKSMASRIVEINDAKVSGIENDSLVILSSDGKSVAFSKITGLITEIHNNDKSVDFKEGPVFEGIESSFRELKYYTSEGRHVVELIYDSVCHATWTMLPGGWLQLDYTYQPSGLNDFSGITFSYPEEKVTGAILMSNGPYHVWKNRLKGTQFGIFSKKYNNTITGQTWEYPEFKGYYSNFYAMEIQTKEMPITIVSSTQDLFLHLFTPERPKHARGGVSPPFPSGNISILNGISAIGTKFSMAEEEGPQGRKNAPGKNPYTGRVFFKFGK